MANNSTSLSNFPSLVQQNKLLSFHPELSLENLLLYELNLSEALSNSTTNKSSITLILQTYFDGSSKEYSGYVYPLARFEHSGNSNETNQIYIGDYFSLHRSALLILEKKFQNIPKILDVIRYQKSQLETYFLEAETYLNETSYLNEQILANYLSTLQSHIISLIEQIRDFLENNVEDEIEQELESDTDTRSQLLEKRKKKRRELAIALEKKLAELEKEKPTKKSEPKPSKEQKPTTSTSDSPRVRTSATTSLPTAPLPTFFKGGSYQIFSVQSGFLYNQVVYDLLSVYGLDGIPIDQLKTLDGWPTIEAEIRQQIVSNLYSLSEQELNDLKLGKRRLLSKKILKQLLLSKAGFSTKLEISLISAPSELISPSRKKSITAHFEASAVDHQSGLAKNLVSHYEESSYQNQYQNDKVSTEFLQLFDSSFSGESFEVIEQKLTKNLQTVLGNDALGTRNVQSAVFAIDKIIREKQDPQVFVSFLSPNQLALILSLDRVPTDEQSRVIRSIIVDYWYQYRTILYRITENDQILTATSSDLIDITTENLSEEEYEALKEFFDQEFSSTYQNIQPNSLEKSVDLSARLFSTQTTTISLFSRKSQLEAAASKSDGNKAWESLFGVADSPAAITASLKINEDLRKKAVEFYLREKKYRQVALLLAIEELVENAETEQLFLEQFENYLSLSQALTAAQAPVNLSSQANFSTVLNQDSVGTKSTAIKNLQSATKNAAKQKLLELAAASNPYLSAALKGKKVLDKIVPQKQQKWILPALSAGAGIAIAAFINFLTNNLLRAVFIGGGGFIGGFFLGPVGFVAGSGLGFLTYEVGSNFVGSIRDFFSVGNETSVSSTGATGFQSIATQAATGTVATATAVTALTMNGVQSAFLQDELDIPISYVEITKTATPNATVNPTEVEYTITITPEDGYTITLREASDSFRINYNQDTNPNGPTTTPSSESFVQFEQQLQGLVGQPLTDSFSASYTVPFTGDYSDASINNTISITYDAASAEETLQSQTDSASARVCFGDCPDEDGCFVFVDPGDSNFSSTATTRFGSAGVTAKPWQSAEKDAAIAAFSQRAGTSESFYNLLCRPNGGSVDREIYLYRLIGNQYGGWAFSNDEIAIYDLGMSFGPGLEYTLVHELGHIIDYRNAEVGGTSFPGFNGDCPPTYPATCNSIEPFAESVALYVVHETYSFFSNVPGGVYDEFPIERPAQFNYIRDNIFSDVCFKAANNCSDF